MKYLKFASIDIGSNAIRILFNNVFETKEGPVFRKSLLVRVPIRLGEDTFTEKRISQEKSDELTDAMHSFGLLMKAHHVLAYRACATSAMREAVNAAEIVDRVERDTGIKIEIISGDQEANTISSKFEPRYLTDVDPLLFVDVGGGSTEITLLKEKKKRNTRSFKIGTVRHLHDKTESSEWEDLNKWLRDLGLAKTHIPIIGSGGNINKIYKMKRHQKQMYVTTQKLKELYKELKPLSVDERIVQYILNPDRADVIVPASEIFLYIIKVTKTEKIFVPKTGLSDGIIRGLYKNYKKGKLKIGDYSPGSSSPFILPASGANSELSDSSES